MGSSETYPRSLLLLFPLLMTSLWYCYSRPLTSLVILPVRRSLGSVAQQESLGWGARERDTLGIAWDTEQQRAAIPLVVMKPY